MTYITGGIIAIIRNHSAQHNGETATVEICYPNNYKNRLERYYTYFTVFTTNQTYNFVVEK